MSRKPVRLAILATDWGRHLHEVAHARGITSVLHTPYTDPKPGSVVFARLSQKAPNAGREWALRHIRQGGPSVQSIHDLKCYENRAYQMDLLRDFFPRGHKVRTVEAAEDALEDLGLPIVSKAAFGSSSSTVRALHTKTEAMQDVQEVLCGGRKFSYATQHGECLWQEFLPGNGFALRVAMITPKLGWAFKVMNRPHDWKASGSGVCVPLTPEEWESPRIRYAINTALEAASVMESRWCAFDLLWDYKVEHGRWRIVDVTLAWNMSRNLAGANYDAPIYNLHSYQPDPKGRQGKDQWDVLCDSLMGLE
jgi:hypothetical protein